MRIYPRKNAARDREILEARKAGQTYASLAVEYGLARERIRQICFKAWGEKAMTYNKQARVDG